MINYSYLKWKLLQQIHHRLCLCNCTVRGLFLVDLVMKYNISVESVAEIGVWKGHTSLTLLQHLPTIKNYHLVDPWINYSEYKMSGDAKANDMILFAQNVCRGRLDDFNHKLIWHKKVSEEAAYEINDQSLDLVFIDGNHAYKFVKQDIELWKPKVKSGGILAGHDLDWKDAPGVRQAVEEKFGNTWNLGPDMVWWIRV